MSLMIIILKLLPLLPGANELILQLTHVEKILTVSIFLSAPVGYLTVSLRLGRISSDHISP